MGVAKLRFGVGEMVFAALFVLGSALTWWGAALLSTSIERSPAPLIIGVFLSAITFSVLIAIEPTERLVARTAVVLGFLLVIPVVFLGNLSLGVPVAAAGALLGVAALWRAERLRDALRTVKVAHVARRSLPIYFSGISIVLTAIVFLSPILATAVANPVPEPLIRLMVRWVDPLLKPVLGVSINQDIDTIIRQGIETRLQRVQEGVADPSSVDLEGIQIKGIDLSALDVKSLEIGSLPPEALQIDSSVIAQQRKAYGERLGITIEGDDNVADILLALIRRQAERFENELASAYRIGFFISAFLLFQLLALPLSWLTIVFLLALLPFLRSLRVVGLTTRQEPRTALRWNLEKAQPEHQEENVG